MHLKTIFKQVTDYKPFIVDKVSMNPDSGLPQLEITMRNRANGQAVCSGCNRRCPGCDRLSTPRRFDFMPLWMIPVVLIYHMRRVDCPACGVRVEQVPWAEGKSSLTTEFKWFLASWAKRMSWKEVAESFCVSWEWVYISVKHAVSRGKSHRSLSNIESIGVDEVQWHRGHKYQTLVYQIDANCKRLLWIGPDRTAKTLLRFFRFLGKERTSRLQSICSDMWQGYVKVIAKKASHAIHVLDRFHVMQKMSKASGHVRASEVKQLNADGYEPILKGSRWLLLKRPENLTDKQAVKLKELLRYNLKSVRSHLMKTDHQKIVWVSHPGCI